MTGRQLAEALTKLAKRLGMVEENGLKRYHVHAHEFRDLNHFG